MVYTVTFNPSLDYIVEVKSFELGMTNRTSYEHMLPGGKGINVSIVLNNLEFDTTAFGFVAGFTGKQICDMVSEYGINTDFIQVDNGFSRINMKIKNIDGTEINGMGPQISEDNLHSLVSKIDRLSSGDVLVLAGSIPSCISDDIYRRIMERLQGRDVKIIVDATSRLLLNVLEYHPFLSSLISMNLEIYLVLSLNLRKRLFHMQGSCRIWELSMCLYRWVEKAQFLLMNMERYMKQMHQRASLRIQ